MAIEIEFPPAGWERYERRNSEYCDKCWEWAALFRRRDCNSARLCAACLLEVVERLTRVALPEAGSRDNRLSSEGTR